MPSTPRTSNSICCNPCIDFGDDFSQELVIGNAYDVIVIRSVHDGYFSNENFIASFSKRIKESHRLYLKLGMANDSDFSSIAENDPEAFELEFDGSFVRKENFQKLGALLKYGRNPFRYLLFDDQTIAGVAYANIYQWSSQSKVVISDIDGTITKSNAGGIYDTILTERYSHCHNAVCQFFSEVATEDEIQVLYVTSRPISLASRTRKFLDNLRQQNHALPDGPVLGFLGNIAQLLVMELVSYQTHHFKAEILWKHVVEPFRKAGFTKGTFQAAFGNTLMDVQAYNMVAVPLNRTYLIKKDKIHSFDKNSNDDEMMNLTVKSRDSAKAWADAMPREWYNRRMGTTFNGYGDPRLREHILLI